jgi:hypothetical protein
VGEGGAAADDPVQDGAIQSLSSLKQTLSKPFR